MAHEIIASFQRGAIEIGRHCPASSSPPAAAHDHETRGFAAVHAMAAASIGRRGFTSVQTHQRAPQSADGSGSPFYLSSWCQVLPLINYPIGRENETEARIISALAITVRLELKVVLSIVGARVTAAKARSHSLSDLHVRPTPGVVSNQSPFRLTVRHQEILILRFS